MLGIISTSKVTRNSIVRTVCICTYLIVIHALITSNIASAAVISFEDKSLGPNSFYNGGPVSNNNGWTSGNVFFNNSYSSDFGGFWSGWSYSNVRNNTTPGFGNQYAAFPGGGVGGSGNYAVAYTSNPLYFDLPTDFRAESARIANTTYAALSMINGDPFAKKFGGATGNDPDFFLLTIRGFENVGAQGNVTGSIPFYLADYRSANNALDYVVSDWQLVDLTSLGNARSIAFTFSSSDVGAFGINTPTYFALDDVSIAAVPEPTSSLFVAMATTIAWYARMRRLRRSASKNLVS
jgi:hypothetical protein